MVSSAHIQKELAAFIQFGEIMDREIRSYLAHALVQHLYQQESDFLQKWASHPASTAYPYWHRLFREFAELKEIQTLAKGQQDLSVSMVRSLFSWVEELNTRMQQEDFQRESNQLNEVRPQQEADWAILLNQLARAYPEHRKSWRFYDARLQEEWKVQTEASGVNSRKEIRLIQDHILEDWHQLFEEKKARHDASFVQHELKDFLLELKYKYQRVLRLSEFLAPYYRFSGIEWSESLGEWDYISWEKIDRHLQKVQQDTRVREIADILGRLQEASRQLIWQSVNETQIKEYWQPAAGAKSEIIGIHHDQDLASVLPSEIALLATPETEVVFAKKYVEHKLLCFQYRNQEKVKRNELNQVSRLLPDPEEKGPFILCIDTSGSMFGKPERIAKAIAFYMAQEAHKIGRRCFLITFSTDVKTYELATDIQTLDGLMEFLTLSFHGGTNLKPALKEAISKLESSAYTSADVLVMSDFAMPRLENTLREAIKRQRSTKGTHFHSLYITRNPDPNMLPPSIFDAHWVYDMEQEGVEARSADFLNKLMG
ncbi:MAG: VWA domain-containing protein [Bacteroidota bacterium]